MAFAHFGIDVYFCGSEEFVTYKNVWMRIGYGFLAMWS
jgi:hypothetical protein